MSASVSTVNSEPCQWAEQLHCLEKRKRKGTEISSPSIKFKISLLLFLFLAPSPIHGVAVDSVDRCMYAMWFRSVSVFRLAVHV